MTQPPPESPFPVVAGNTTPCPSIRGDTLNLATKTETRALEFSAKPPSSRATFSVSISLPFTKVFSLFESTTVLSRGRCVRSFIGRGKEREREGEESAYVKERERGIQTGRKRAGQFDSESNLLEEMAYSWDNRVGFIVRFLYDIDNNGQLEKHDFECMALKMTLIEGKGEFSYNRYQENLHIMCSLWEEIAELADFNKDGIVTIEEFKEAVQRSCVGRSYRDFPQAMKMFIDSHFKLVDLNDDGVIAADEYRYNCVTRIPVDNVDVLDAAYQNLLNDDDRRRGGLTLSRYQELYAQFLGDPDENCPAVHLFGPLHAMC